MRGIETAVPVVLLKLFHHCELGAIRSLGRLGVPVYGMHDDLHSPPARSRYLRGVVPWSLDRADDAESVERVLAYGREIGGRPMLLATDDRTGDFLADNADALATAFRFPAMPAALARALSDKQQLHAMCLAHDVPTPSASYPRSVDDVHAFLRDATPPVVLKGIDAYRLQQRTGRRMAIARDAAELLELYAELEDPDAPNLMLQEYIPGGPDSVWMMNGYFDSESECHLAVTGQKLRQFPVDTGMTSLGICRPNPEVEALTRRFMRRLGYRGILDIGWRYDARDGRYKLLDVNPRLGSTFRLFAGTNGMDVVRAQYLDLTGQPLPASEARYGRRWLVENYDAGSLLSARWQGRPVGPRAWARSLRGVQEVAYFAPDDLRPFAVMAQRAVQRLRDSAA